jgi:hypothetical protein
MTNDAVYKLLGDAPHSKQTINLSGEEIVLDNSRLAFNSSNLSLFMENLSLWYDYFSQKLAEAEALLAYKEYEYDVAFAKKYEESKEQGCTDKLAEAAAKKNEEVCHAKKDVISCKYKVMLLKQHLRAWDKAHENAQSRGHMIRKEMDKLNLDVMESKVDYIVGKS